MVPYRTVDNRCAITGAFNGNATDIRHWYVTQPPSTLPRGQIFAKRDIANNTKRASSENGGGHNEHCRRRSSSYDNSGRSDWKRPAFQAVPAAASPHWTRHPAAWRSYSAPASEQRPEVKRKTARRTDGNKVASAAEEISIILMVAVRAAFRGNGDVPTLEDDERSRAATMPPANPSVPPSIILMRRRNPAARGHGVP